MEQGSESVASEPRGRAAIYSVELEVFEGPLDLLLHLVRRHELEILDIPIAFVAEKYLEYLGMMRALDLEVAGDYLVMAATLAWLKSRELLPVVAKPGEEPGADDEEGEDPREALIRRLVEYERFKNAASQLDALPMSGRDVFARGADIEMPAMDPGLAPVTLFRLAEAYYKVLTRAKINKSHEVQIEAVTVAQRMQQLTLMLDQRQEFEFEGLFLGRSWTSELELRTMLVVTLMSILELVKLGVARVQQVPDTDSIRIYRLSITEEARQQIEAYDEDQSFGAPVDLGPVDLTPQATEAELDAAEERTLLAEALAGVHAANTDLGPEAAEAVAANSFEGPVLSDMSEEACSTGQVEEPDEDLRLLATELAALAVAETASDGEGQGVMEAALDEEAAPVVAAESALDEELRLLAAELAALDAAEAVAEAVTFARGQVQFVGADETDATNAAQDAENEDDS